MKKNINKKDISQHDFIITMRKLEIREILIKSIRSSFYYLLLFLCIYLSIKALSGKITVATIDQNFISISDLVKQSSLWGWLFSIIEIIMLRVIWKIYRTNKKRMGNRIKELEEYIDEHRSSSKLDVFGETPKKNN